MRPTPAAATLCALLALLAGLLRTAVSGLKLYAVEEGKGPLAQLPPIGLVEQARADSDDHGHGRHGDEDAENFWEDLHEFSVNLMLVLTGVHVAGVIVSSRLPGESLVEAMITGYKAPSDPAD